jgi:hypothetical protein
VSFANLQHSTLAHNQLVRGGADRKHKRSDACASLQRMYGGTQQLQQAKEMMSGEKSWDLLITLETAGDTFNTSLGVSFHRRSNIIWQCTDLHLSGRDSSGRLGAYAGALSSFDILQRNSVLHDIAGPRGSSAWINSSTAAVLLL